MNILILYLSMVCHIVILLYDDPPTTCHNLTQDDLTKSSRPRVPDLHRNVCHFYPSLSMVIVIDGFSILFRNFHSDRDRVRDLSPVYIKPPTSFSLDKDLLQYYGHRDLHATLSFLKLLPRFDVFYARLTDYLFFSLFSCPPVFSSAIGRGSLLITNSLATNVRRTDIR